MPADLISEDYVDWERFPDQHVVQLNDQMNALAILELLRILIDDENLTFDRAYNSIVREMFTCTISSFNKYDSGMMISVEILQNVLPRHLRLIEIINFEFIQQLQEQYPDQGEKWSRMSLYEENHPKSIRMNNLILLCCEKVCNMTSDKDLLTVQDMYRDFNGKVDGQILRVTPGVSHVRWLYQINRPLTKLIDKYMALVPQKEG